jgi:cysteine desulfurase/selenocysteine lyase
VILVTRMEHHANMVPWQLIAERTGAHIVPVEITPEGELDLPALKAQLKAPVKILALSHVSNVLGTVNPVAQICEWARKAGITTVIDGSQAAPHMAVDIPSLGCDFYAFTGHKMCGPTGTGGLWAKRGHLQAMPPFFGGGEMIREVSFEKTTFNDPPHKFEAGTPNIAGFVGLGAAVDYTNAIGMHAIGQREQELLAYATGKLRAVNGLRIIGEAAHKAAVISFLIDGTHAHDLATLLDLEGIAVRSGHHCAHPLMRFYGVPATCRASFAFYNTEAEIDALITGIDKTRKMLG